MAALLCENRPSFGRFKKKISADDFKFWGRGEITIIYVSRIREFHWIIAEILKYCIVFGVRTTFC